MQKALFARFARLALDRAGISLKDGKEALVEARIGKRMRALRLPDAAAYVEYLEEADDAEELLRFLDVISTHFTSFFREPDHFEEAAALAQAWADKGQRRFRFWSAACSTGEEPYSWAMVLLSRPGWDRLDWKILATDISAQALEQAAAGVYDEGRVEAVPSALSRRFLVPAPGGAVQRHLAVADAVRSRVVFRRLNLAQPPWPMTGPLDVVLCRNVLIYFDQPTRQRLVGAVEGLIRPGGLFCLGHTETLSGIRTRLRLVRPSVFRRPVEEGSR